MKYARDQAKPSIDIAAKVAKYLDVSLDFLSGNVEDDIDHELTGRVLAIQSLPRKEREIITYTLDALVRDARARATYGSG